MGCSDLVSAPRGKSFGAVQSVTRRSKQGGAVIEDDSKRNLPHEFAEASFGEKSF
jgi:hypothetical protein